MPTFANIVIADGKATPVTHTFVPGSEDPKGVFNHVEINSTSAIGSNILRASLASPPVTKGAGSASTADRVYRVKVNLAIPVLEVTSPTTSTGIQPAPTVAYVLRANVEFILPERSSAAERTDLRILLRNALGNNQIVPLVDALQSLY